MIPLVEPRTTASGTASPAHVMHAVHAVHAAHAEALTRDAGTVDYDVHGLLGVRLVEPAPADVAFVERHLRGFRRPLGRQPDLVVRYVDRLPTDALRCVDVARSGFDDEAYYVRGGAGTGWVRIPFDRIGEPCELVAERGTGAIAHLKAVLRLVALQRGYVPVHGSAFACGETGVLVTGWTHGGKTSALLAFAEHGARFVGDDLVLVTQDGRRMYGLRTPLGVSLAQLRQSARLRGQVNAGRRLVLEGLDRIERVGAHLAPRWPRAARPLALVRRAAVGVQRRLGVHVPPERAFPSGLAASAEPCRLVLVLSHRRPEVVVERAEAMDLVERMAHSNRFEDLALLGEYAAFRFAFPQPQRANALLERAHDIGLSRLRRAFAGVEAFVVRHPYPPPLGALYDAMAPLCGGVAASSSNG